MLLCCPRIHNVQSGFKFQTPYDIYLYDNSLITHIGTGTTNWSHIKFYKFVYLNNNVYIASLTYKLIFYENDTIRSLYRKFSDNPIITNICNEQIIIYGPNIHIHDTYYPFNYHKIISKSVQNIHISSNILFYDNCIYYTSEAQTINIVNLNYHTIQHIPISDNSKSTIWKNNNILEQCSHNSYTRIDLRDPRITLSANFYSGVIPYNSFQMHDINCLSKYNGKWVFEYDNRKLTVDGYMCSCDSYNYPGGTISYWYNRKCVSNGGHRLNIFKRESIISTINKSVSCFDVFDTGDYVDSPLLHHIDSIDWWLENNTMISHTLYSIILFSVNIY